MLNWPFVNGPYIRKKWFFLTCHYVIDIPSVSLDSPAEMVVKIVGEIQIPFPDGITLVGCGNDVSVGIVDLDVLGLDVVFLCADVVWDVIFFVLDSKKQNKTQWRSHSTWHIYILHLHIFQTKACWFLVLEMFLSKSWVSSSKDKCL